LEIGKNHEILVERRNKGNPVLMEGRTRTNKLVLFKGGEDLKGQMVTVNIVDSGTWHLDGEMLKGNYS